MNLLIELGCEELPALGLTALAGQFAEGVAAALKKRGVQFSSAKALWTPRRLVVQVFDLPAAQETQHTEKRGPASAAALDASGAPSKALLGFAASCGVGVEALVKLESDKGSWFVHRASTPGRATAELLPEVITEALTGLAIAKPMRWGDNNYAFLRPVHWLVVLLDDAVIAMQALGVDSDRVSFGHRFHAPAAIRLEHADHYAKTLLAAQVQVDPALRAQTVRTQVQLLAAEIAGLAVMPENLVDEVVNLTEWPVPIRCAIPSEFMRLPAATIMTTIETHQRYFPIKGADGALLPAFVGVANIASTDANEIRKGYERVVRPRLADADFFYQQDLKTPLANNQELLKTVTFQIKLGTVWDKSLRRPWLKR
jgi:glycyl-tRNA synthetase beta chain